MESQTNRLLIATSYMYIRSYTLTSCMVKINTYSYSRAGDKNKDTEKETSYVLVYTAMDAETDMFT